MNQEPEEIDQRAVRAAKRLNPALQLWRWDYHNGGYWKRVENPKWYPWNIFSCSSHRDVRPPDPDPLTLKVAKKIRKRLAKRKTPNTGPRAHRAHQGLVV